MQTMSAVEENGGDFIMTCLSLQRGGTSRRCARHHLATGFEQYSQLGFFHWAFFYTHNTPIKLFQDTKSFKLLYFAKKYPPEIQVHVQDQIDGQEHRSCPTRLGFSWTWRTAFELRYRNVSIYIPGRKSWRINMLYKTYVVLGLVQGRVILPLLC